jgi:hypothetical protein
MFTAVCRLISTAGPIVGALALSWAATRARDGVKGR